MSHAHPNGNGHPSAAEPSPPLTEQAQTVVEALTEGLTEKVRENPYAMVAAALGVGYVIGGGLFTKTTMRVLELGAKLAMVPAVRGPLLDLAEKAIDSALARAAPLSKSDERKPQ